MLNDLKRRVPDLLATGRDVKAQDGFVRIRVSDRTLADQLAEAGRKAGAIQIETNGISGDPAGWMAVQAAAPHLKALPNHVDQAQSRTPPLSPVSKYLAEQMGHVVAMAAERAVSRSDIEAVSAVSQALKAVVDQSQAGEVGRSLRGVSDDWLVGGRAMVHPMPDGGAYALVRSEAPDTLWASARVDAQGRPMEAGEQTNVAGLSLAEAASMIEAVVAAERQASLQAEGRDGAPVPAVKPADPPLRGLEDLPILTPEGDRLHLATEVAVERFNTRYPGLGRDLGGMSEAVDVDMALVAVSVPDWPP
ncbi:hypothetical protein, partial [Azospirillum sp. B4]|uniref:hypothetical protein n=1 Tax=Azospirillum sp. B4 TaxID=95605 RepID=UPI0005CAA300